MKTLLSVFKDDRGNPSYIRVSSFLLLLSFIVDWMHSVFICNKVFDPSYSIVALVAGSLGIKVWQKSIENK